MQKYYFYVKKQNFQQTSFKHTSAQVNKLTSKQADELTNIRLANLSACQLVYCKTTSTRYTGTPFRATQV